MLSRDYEPVIGIEIHVQLSTNSKIFCGDSTKFEAGDNENTSPVSVGMPGTLPVVNRKAIEYSIKTGLALGCTIRNVSVFSRKITFIQIFLKAIRSLNMINLCVKRDRLLLKSMEKIKLLELLEPIWKKTRASLITWVILL